jgi:hypothetical protein
MGLVCSIKVKQDLDYEKLLAFEAKGILKENFLLKYNRKVKQFLTKPFTRYGQKTNWAHSRAGLLDQNCTMWQEEIQYRVFQYF